MGYAMPMLLLQQPQLLQSLPPVPIRNALWGYLDTDTGGSRKLVITLSFEGWLLGALVLLQANQLASLDSCKSFPMPKEAGRGRELRKALGETLSKKGLFPRDVLVWQLGSFFSAAER